MAASIIDSLITDRTQRDVDRVTELEDKINGGTATAAELQEYLGSMKGAYNTADLNRVGNAILYLADWLNANGYPVKVTPKTDWVDNEVLQDAQELTHYLDQVQIIRGVLPLPGNTPTVPADVEQLTYQEANDIERILQTIEAMTKNMAAAWFYSGEIYAGEV